MDRGFPVRNERKIKIVHVNPLCIFILWIQSKVFLFLTVFLSDNELVFLDSDGGLSILEVNSLNQSRLLNNIVFVSIILTISLIFFNYSALQRKLTIFLLQKLNISNFNSTLTVSMSVVYCILLN